jgi:hypothetical protein
MEAIWGSGAGREEGKADPSATLRDDKKSSLWDGNTEEAGADFSVSGPGASSQIEVHWGAGASGGMGVVDIWAGSTSKMRS